jgi:hypothetical protein
MQSQSDIATDSESVSKFVWCRANPHTLQINRANAKSSHFVFTCRSLVTDLNNEDSSVSVFGSLLLGEYPATELTRKKQKLTVGNQPVRSFLASSPAGTHGHRSVQYQDLCVFPFVVPPFS